MNELSLFNRVGDLYLKVSRVPEAVEMYERAATLYAEHGFPNNAIALCNKVLRNAPGRTHMYLKLAQLMVERGFVAEAKQNLLEYAERMQKAGKTDDAFRALKDFADLSPDNEEIRLMLAEQLKNAERTSEAREQLAKLFAEAQARGDERRSRMTLQQIRAIDPDFDVSQAPKPKVKERKDKSSELVFLDLDDEMGVEPEAAKEEEADEEPPAGPSLGLIEPFDGERSEGATALDGVEDLEVERVAPEPRLEPDEVDTLDGLDSQQTFAPEAVDLPALDIQPTSLAGEAEAEVADTETEGIEAETVERTKPEPEAVEVDQTLDLEASVEDVGDELPLLDISDDELASLGEEAGAVDVPELDLEGFDVRTESESAGIMEAGEAGAPPDEGVELPLLLEPDAIAEPEPVGDVEREVEREAAAEAVAPDVPALEAAVADDPDDPARHVSLGEALLETGKRERGLEELDIALRLHEGRENWGRVSGLIDEILRLDPNSVRHHQKRVEAAYRSGEKHRLVDSYLGLGDALVRTGSLERARLVYQRVLEHDPKSAQAHEAIASLEPEQPAAGAPSPAGQGEYVNLGALILEEEAPVRDTRMRIEEEEPTGDEERDFAEMLSQFKRGIEANIEEDDWRAHYDLGVAFKEMGLLDEAIAEFQKALRSPAGRLRTAEALGACFFDKAQFSVAATVMRRAIETDGSGDDAKIGLLYWLGRCEEELTRMADALNHYQRVFALDIRFKDVAERVKRLTGAGH